MTPMSTLSLRSVAIASVTVMMLQVARGAAETVAPGTRVVVRQNQVLFATKAAATGATPSVPQRNDQTMSLEVVADHGDALEVRTVDDPNECIPGYSLGGYTPQLIVRVFVAKRDVLPRLRQPQVRTFPDHTGFALRAGAPMLPVKGGFAVMGLDALPPPLFDSAAVTLGIVPSSKVLAMPAEGQPLVCSRKGVITEAQAEQQRKQEEKLRMEECQRKAAATTAAATAPKQRKNTNKATLSDEAAVEAFADILSSDDRCSPGGWATQGSFVDYPEYCTLPTVLHVGGVDALHTTSLQYGQLPREQDGVRTAEVSLRCVTLRVSLPTVATPYRGGIGSLTSRYSHGRQHVEEPPYEAWGVFTWPDGSPAGTVAGKGRLQLAAESVQKQKDALCTKLRNMAEPICFGKKNFRQLPKP